MQRRTSLAWGMLCSLRIGTVLAEEPVKPRGLQISPNAMQDPAQPLQLHVQAGPRQPLWVLILRDCDRDGSQPELTPRPGCPTPLRTQRIETDDNGQYVGIQGLGDLPGQPLLPRGEALWLRVAAVEGGDRLFEDVIFALRSQTQTHCDAWRVVLASFGMGPCRLGLERVFNPVRGTTQERPQAVLHAVRMNPRHLPLGSQAVPGTRGATGVSWDGPAALLVTLGPASGGLAGLHRVDLNSGARTRVFATPAERTLAAPLSLGRGRIALIEEVSDGPATLLLLQDGRVCQRWLLSRTVHELLAVDTGGHRVLASSYFRGEPQLFTVDLLTGEEVVMADHSLPLAALASRRDGLIVQDVPEAAGPGDWDLVLLNPQGAIVRGLVQGPGQALLPDWNPDGGELIYLGEVGGGISGSNRRLRKLGLADLSTMGRRQRSGGGGDTLTSRGKGM